LNTLLVAAIVANLADLASFLRVDPAIVAAQETNPLPHLLGPTLGAVAAKLVMLAIIVITVIAFKKKPRTRATLIGIFTVLAAVGALSNLTAG
jgi:hypothetical protein